MLRIAGLLIGLLGGLVWLIPANAALYTVGAGGTHTTVQGAIDAALVAPDSDEIRVGSGTYNENLNMFPSGSGNMLFISGGWDEVFTTRSDVPSVIDGGMLDAVVQIDLGAGDGLVLENLKFQNGNARSGGGMTISQIGGSTLRISDCEISNNIAEDDRASSGGLNVYVDEGSTFSLLDSHIADNQTICNGDVDCREGGMGLQALASSQVTMSRNSFINNSVTIAEGSAFAGGASLLALDNSVLIVEDNQFIGNAVTGTSSNGTGIGLALNAAGTITARRNRLEANSANLPDSISMPQLTMSISGNNTGILTDSIIVNSAKKGVVANIGGDGSPTLYLVNITVADHADTGIQLSKFSVGGVINLSNSIAVDNNDNTSFGEGVTHSNNLLTGSAGFVDASGGNYALAEGSPAINAGNNAPPGGLGPTDIAGNARINESIVDLGAYEYQSDVTFADGFETQ